MSSRFLLQMPAAAAHGAAPGCGGLAPCAGMELAQAAEFLRSGGALVFPTETFYGVGCLAANADAVARVYQLKRRPVHKPLPLLAAHAAQVDEVAELAAMPRGLLSFWPGPLTVLLPARPCLPPALVNGEGLAAVRVTPHPLAAQLAVEAGGAHCKQRQPQRRRGRAHAAAARSGPAGGVAAHGAGYALLTSVRRKCCNCGCLPAIVAHIGRRAAACGGVALNRCRAVEL